MNCARTKVAKKTGVALVQIILLAMALDPVSTYSQNCESSIADQAPIATIGGQPVFLHQASPALQGQLARLRQTQFELEEKAIDEVISRQLLANEAKRKELSVEELLEREVDVKISEPTAGELEAYSLAGKSTDDQVALRELLRKAKIKAARQQFADQLRAQRQVAVLIRPPTVDVACDLARMRGGHDSPVTIIEFSDFSCPYCKRAEQTLKQVMAKYGEKVSLSYRDFPLVQIHPYAKTAAEAARCALEYGKFWEYHDLLFASSSELDLETLVDEARKIGIDEHQFGSCVMSGKHRSEVDRDIDDGLPAGVQTTPAFFINGVYLSGAQPIESFQKIIDQELIDALRAAQMRR